MTIPNIATFDHGTDLKSYYPHWNWTARTWKWIGLEDFLVSFWGVFFGLFSGANWLLVAGRVEIFDSQCFGGSVAQSSTELFGP